MNFVQLNIEEATLKDRQLNQVQFHLPLKTTKLPNVFNLMESARGDPDLQLEDYSISQMTLDEVRTFLVFLSAPPLITPRALVSMGVRMLKHPYFFEKWVLATKLFETLVLSIFTDLQLWCYRLCSFCQRYQID